MIIHIHNFISSDARKEVASLLLEVAGQTAKFDLIRACKEEHSKYDQFEVLSDGGYTTKKNPGIYSVLAWRLVECCGRESIPVLLECLRLSPLEWENYAWPLIQIVTARDWPAEPSPLGACLDWWSEYGPYLSWQPRDPGVPPTKTWRDILEGRFKQHVLRGPNIMNPQVRSGKSANSRWS
jgi:hypothetical protein